MANLLYVDNSNVWIEGMHVAAYKSGMATDVWTAVKGNICYHSWKIDFGKLFSFAGGDKKEVRKAALFGSKPPKNDSLWSAAERNGLEVIIYVKIAPNLTNAVALKFNYNLTKYISLDFAFLPKLLD
jgi:hypothetical protein